MDLVWGLIAASCAVLSSVSLVIVSPASFPVPGVTQVEPSGRITATAACRRGDDDVIDASNSALSGLLADLDLAASALLLLRSGHRDFQDAVVERGLAVLA